MALVIRLDYRNISTQTPLCLVMIGNTTFSNVKPDRNCKLKYEDGSRRSFYLTEKNIWRAIINIDYVQFV